MTPDAILQAIDQMELVASKVPSCGVAKTIVRSKRVFWAVRRQQRFLVILKITVGPKGGVMGYIFLRDTEITPAVDSIRIGEVPDFSTESMMPLSQLFWQHDKKVVPDEEVILSFLQSKITGLPNENQFYEKQFAEGFFDTPASSINGLQGGAPGLGG